MMEPKFKCDWITYGHPEGSATTYGHPEGSAAGDITIIWNDVFKLSVDCAHPFLSFIYFLLPSPSHGVPSFLGFENLFAIYPSV